MRLVWMMVMIVWLAITSVAQGAAGISLTVNGEILEEASQISQIVNDRILVPIRFVSEQLGAEVEWYPSQNAALVTKDKLEIIIIIDSVNAFVNGEKVVLDVPATLEQNRTLVPLRFVSESLGTEVEWDDKSRTVTISTMDSLENKAVIPYTEEDFEWLAKIIEAESGAESFEGKLAVGAVIVNRVQSSHFPNTIKEVIFEKSSSGYYQFSPVRDKRIYEVTPSSDSIEAAKKALMDEDPTNGAIYFYNPSTSKSTWILSRSVVKRIGNHAFAK